MSDFQVEKKVILSFYSALQTAPLDKVEEVCSQFISKNYLWQSYHPFSDQYCSKDLAKQFWIPLKKSIKSLQRRQDIFIAGQNEIDNFQSTWVVSMGHLMGLFDESWLGIQPTNKMVLLRYAEFNKVEKNKIIQTAMYFDIPHFMTQANLNPFPNATGMNLVQPGPMTHDGLYFTKQKQKTGKKTLSAINYMINSLGNWDNKLSLEKELQLSWHDDMIWWGPTGIGSTFTIERYATQHSGPFRQAFSNRKFNGHVCRLTEGNFGGFFGRPNLTLTLTGEFMGIPPTGYEATMNIVDLYRREGSKLSENWVFIDLLGFWLQHGIDVLADSLNACR